MKSTVAKAIVAPVTQRTFVYKEVHPTTFREEPVKWVREHYDLTPNGIINTLGLRDVDYNRTAALGHFWDQLMPWEN